jgi:hypothetical protein
MSRGSSPEFSLLPVTMSFNSSNLHRNNFRTFISNTLISLGIEISLNRGCTDVAMMKLSLSKRGLNLEKPNKEYE